MTDRRVTHVDRNDQGDIVGVCWSAVDGLKYTPRADVVSDIERAAHQYYVAEQAPPVWVLVRIRNGMKYITTEADAISQNNLDNLPACTKA
jgi:Protein of unknown function (DUF3892)